MIATHRALDHHFLLEGDSGGIALLVAVCSPLADRSPGSPADAVYRLEHLGGSWRSSRDGHVLHDGEAGVALSHLITSVNTQAIASVGPLPVVHCGAVAGRSGVVLLPGSPGAGKSTLTCALVARGFAYLTDEAAPLLEGGMVRPYPKPIVVGPGSFEVLADLRPCDLAGGSLGLWFLDPSGLPGGTTSDPLPLRWVALPQFSAGASAQLIPISRGEIVAALASNLFNLQALGQEALDALEQISRQVRGYRLVHGSATDAAAAIGELVGL